MTRVAVFVLFALALAEASVSVTRSTREAPHPSSMEIEVHLPNKSKRVRIPLSRTEALDDAAITVMENGVSRTFSGRQARHADHANYRDINTGSVLRVRNDRGKKRFSGHIIHDGTAYTVEPIGNSEHRFTKRAHSMMPEPRILNEWLTRKKRQWNQARAEFEIEIHILCDHTVWNTFKSIYGSDDKALMELHFYYTHILNGMDTVYRNIGNPSMSVRCVGLTVAKTQADAKWLPPAGSADVNNGGAILGYIRAYSEGNTADHVMAFTRTNIHVGGNSAVTGVAFVAGACQDQKVSIVEDAGLHSWLTAAHELAHNLGAADHDSNGAGCEMGLKYIMSPAAGSYDLNSIANSYRFSPCSVKAIKNYLKSGQANCLKTRQGSPVAKLTGSVREGARMSLNQVCRLAYPESPGIFFLTDDINSKPALLCTTMYCSMTAGAQNGVTKSGLRAPVGSPCGNKKSCNWNGQCTADESAPEADESCFFGDRWGDTCPRWEDYIKYLRESNAIDNAKVYCAQAFSGCCTTLKTLCKF